MYTKILAQGTKFGSGTTGLNNPVLEALKFAKMSKIYVMSLIQSREHMRAMKRRIRVL